VKSESFRLSQLIVEGLTKIDGVLAGDIVEIDANLLPHVDAEYASALGAPTDPDGYKDGSLRQSDQLIQSLSDADYLVIATPMHNYTVPSALKVWIDHVVRVRSTFNATPKGKVGTLPDRPVFVAISSGANFSGADARQPDFLTPYLKTALATIGLTQVKFFSVEGSATGWRKLEDARLRAQAEISEYFSSRSATGLWSSVPAPPHETADRR
jgi:FMN-dependent NADH-azoreductase